LWIVVDDKDSHAFLATSPQAHFNSCASAVAAQAPRARFLLIRRRAEVTMTVSPTSSQAEEPSNIYGANCYHCGTPFDAMTAEWCSCLVRERSFLCPACRQCFCPADYAYKRNFWMYAPDLLWQRKVRTTRHQTETLPNPVSPDTAARPLVMVVDDDREIVAVAAQLIRSWGFGCLQACDGMEALVLAKAFKPDVILADALMPKMDGRELCLRVKSDPELAATSVIIMSSVYTSGRFKREALSQFKADDYVAKPVDSNLLLKLVNRANDALEPPWPAIDKPVEAIGLEGTMPLPAHPLLTIAGEQPLPAIELVPSRPPPAPAPPDQNLEEEIRNVVPPPRLARVERAHSGFTVTELIQMRAAGVDGEMIALAKTLTRLRAADLIAISAAGVPVSFIRQLDAESLDRFSAADLITLHCSGCDPQAATELFQFGFEISDITALVAGGVPPQFICEAIEVAEQPLAPTALMRLYAAGVNIDFIRALKSGGYESLAVDEWIRLSAAGVSPQFISAATIALRQKCSTEELLRLWLTGVDTTLLSQLGAF
jgi:CheY-like chemotaxis protein